MITITGRFPAPLVIEGRFPPSLVITGRLPDAPSSWLLIDGYLDDDGTWLDYEEWNDGQ